MSNRIVVRFRDGKMLKGNTTDFVPTRDIFHVIPADAPTGSPPVDVYLRELKAVFFVKDYKGDSDYHEKHDFAADKLSMGRKIRVEFSDGEVIIGTTQGYRPDRPGFFIIPVDPKSNIERCYVLTDATKEVEWL